VLEREVSEPYDTLVAMLAVPHHAKSAHRALLGRGLDALPAVRAGLAHQNADVRYWCCQFLDHFLTSEVMDELVGMLNDADHRVRCSTLHALTCERCKEGSCRPEERKVLPQAIALLGSDPDPHVRAHAIGLVGRWVHTNRDAEAALLQAMKSDLTPAVRKKAGWYVPGGTIYQRTAPKVSRVAGKDSKPEL
jgi:hypothetical protein